MRIREVTNPLLEIYEAPVKKGMANTAIIICPGGGYSILAYDLEGREIASWLNSIGITAFVLQYRVPQNRTGALQDAQRAIRIVRSRAAEFGINPSRIGIMGFSAGGSLSARLSCQYKNTLYPFIDKVDSVSANPDFSILIYPAYLDEGKDLSLSPDLNLDSTMSPFFIFQTADDPYGNSALVMTTALRNKKIPVELHIYPSGGHGYGLRPGKVASVTWPVLLSNWLNHNFSK